MDTSIDRRRYAQTAAEAQAESFKAIRNLMVIFVLLVFLGFPGTLSKVIGGGTSKLIEYLAFGLQFLLVMLATGNDVMSIKLVNLHPAYWISYIYVVYVTADSLVVSINRKTVIMTILHMILTVMFALWMVEQFDIEELLTLFYNAQFVFIATTLLCSVAFSRITFYNYQGSMTFRGLFSTKNECGTELAFGIIVQLILLRIRIQKKAPISMAFIGSMFVQFMFMLITKNMGALLIVMICISYVVYYSIFNKSKDKKKRPKRLPLGLLFIVITVGFLFFALTVLQALEPVLNALGKDASLTGRVPLWNQTIVVMQQSHTLTGYGLEMFWKTPNVVKTFHSGFRENSWAATSSASTHNMLMETWCNLGLIGLALLFFMFLMGGRGIKYMEEDQYLFASSYLVMFTVRSLTERQTNPSTIYMLGMFVILAMMFQAQYRHKIKVQKKARVYKFEEEKSVMMRKLEINSNSDMAAFQKKFSNLSGSRPSSVNRTPVPTRMHRHEEETDEKKNTLQSLLQEFDDDSY